MKNAEKFLVKITTQKISEQEPLELYFDLITPDIIELEKTKGKGKGKKYHVLNVLKTLESVFTGVYLHYYDKPSESEKSTAEKTKLRRQRSDEIANKEKMINPEFLKKYFEYLSPSDMHKKLNETIGTEENKTQVNAIESDFKNGIENMSKEEKEIEKPYEIKDIVEKILKFNRRTRTKNTNTKPNA